MAQPKQNQGGPTGASSPETVVAGVRLAFIAKSGSYTLGDYRITPDVPLEVPAELAAKADLTLVRVLE